MKQPKETKISVNLRDVETFQDIIDRVSATGKKPSELTLWGLGIRSTDYEYHNVDSYGLHKITFLYSREETDEEMAQRLMDAKKFFKACLLEAKDKIQDVKQFRDSYNKEFMKLEERIARHEKALKELE